MGGVYFETGVLSGVKKYFLYLDNFLKIFPA
jgi:hypothetical protein